MYNFSPIGKALTWALCCWTDPCTRVSSVAVSNGGAGLWVASNTTCREKLPQIILRGVFCTNMVFYPPPPARPRYEKCPARARVKAYGFTRMQRCQFMKMVGRGGGGRDWQISPTYLPLFFLLGFRPLYFEVHKKLTK